MHDAEDLELDWSLVMAGAQQYRVVRDQEKLLAKRKRELRDRLFSLVLHEGHDDGKGHLFLEFPTPFDGIQGLQVRRSVSTPLDTAKAEEILRSIPVSDGTLWDSCVEYVPMLDEDKLLAFRYEGVLNDEQIEQMYPRVVSESLWVVGE